MDWSEPKRKQIWKRFFDAYCKKEPILPGKHTGGLGVTQKFRQAIRVENKSRGRMTFCRGYSQFSKTHCSLQSNSAHGLCSHWWHLSESCPASLYELKSRSILEAQSLVHSSCTTQWIRRWSRNQWKRYPYTFPQRFQLCILLWPILLDSPDIWKQEKSPLLQIPRFLQILTTQAWTLTSRTRVSSLL